MWRGAASEYALFRLIASSINPVSSSKAIRRGTVLGSVVNPSTSTFPTPFSERRPATRSVSRVGVLACSVRKTRPTIHGRTKLLFWKKMYTNSNVVLYTLSRYAGVPNRSMAAASQYGIHSLRQTLELSSLLSGCFFTETVHI